MMSLQFAAAPSPAFVMAEGAQPFALSGVKLLHLTGEQVTDQVRALRGEIDLSVHAAAGSQFIHLEKKETSWASSSASSSKVN